MKNFHIPHDGISVLNNGVLTNLINPTNNAR